MQLEISPKEVVLSPQTIATLADEVTITLKNEEMKGLLLKKNDYQVTVEAHAQKTDRQHCESVQEFLTARIENFLTHKTRKVFNDDNTILVLPKESLRINFLLSELSRHPFFKDHNHQFQITITFKDVTQRFTLHSNFGEEAQMNLEYRGNQPFYLNLAEASSLKLYLAGEQLSNWVNLNGGPPRLKGSLSASFQLHDAQNPTHLAVKQAATGAIGTIEWRVQQTPNPKEVILILDFGRMNPLAFAIPEDVPGDLTIILNAIDGQRITETLVAVLQRPAFAGYAALDFGTTNSACVYYNPSQGLVVFPDRTLSHTQLSGVRGVVDALLVKLQEQVATDPRYEVLVRRLTQFAAMWAMQAGHHIKTPSNLRTYLQNLAKEINLDFVNEECTRLLVSWGTHNYAQFCRTHPPEIARFLAKQYDTCMDSIINRDIQKDFKTFLPELEHGNEGGTISSAILMDKLYAKPSVDDNQPIYPEVDAFKSKISMGIGVEIAMNDPAPQNQLHDAEKGNPNDLHKIFLAGAKRWIGDYRTAIFIDKPGAAFRDVYDPLCESGIKYLLNQTEKHINPGATKDSPGTQHINTLVVTYPANMSQRRRDRLKDIVKATGVQTVDLSFDEATAGALYYIWRELFTDIFAGIDGFLARSRVSPELMLSEITGKEENRTVYKQNILVYDMGGGTTDIALLEMGVYEYTELLPLPPPQGCGRYFVIRPKILGLTGRNDFAGDNITLAVFRLLKSKLAEYVAPKLRDKGSFTPNQEQVMEKIAKFEDSKHQSENTDLSKANYFTQWFTASTGKEYRELRDDIDILVSTRFSEKPNQRFAFFQLWNEAEQIKKELSSSQTTGNIAARGAKLLPAIQHLGLGIAEYELTNITVTRGEMEEIIKKDIQGTFEKARDLCVGGNDHRPYLQYPIDRVVLAGSSSYLRLVREVMPEAVLGKPFKVRYGNGVEVELPAPFKRDNYNLIFEPKDAKLAVARGACLPRFFRETAVHPRHPGVAQKLQQGISFLNFDVDNLHHYVPFTLKYNTGTGEEILLRAGDEMREQRETVRIIRKRVIPTEIMRFYRVENSFSTINDRGVFYCQFGIDDAIAQHQGWQQDSHSQKIIALRNRWAFYVEFDEERHLTCRMYVNEAGNADKKYVNQLAPMNQAQLTAAVCDRQPDGSVVSWKPVPCLKCRSNALGAPEIINFRSTTGTQANQLVADVPMRSVFEFYADTPAPALLGSINLNGYIVKNPEFAQLRMTLELQNNAVTLKYTVFDPNFYDDKDNILISELPLLSTGEQLFNPFRGDE